jgi:hypothetical protein
MQITDKSDRLKQLIDARKERDYVLCEEILDQGYVGGRELDDILLELANAAIEVFEEPKNATNRRTRENGIRMAVGADAMSVLRMVLQQAQAWWLAVLALACCWPWPWKDGLYLILPALLAVTVVAAFIPARKASRIEPTGALRYE